MEVLIELLVYGVRTSPLLACAIGFGVPILLAFVKLLSSNVNKGEIRK